MKRINQLQNPFELSNLILENARAGVANQMLTAALNVSTLFLPSMVGWGRRLYAAFRHPNPAQN